MRLCSGRKNHRSPPKESHVTRPRPINSARPLSTKEGGDLISRASSWKNIAPRRTRASCTSRAVPVGSRGRRLRGKRGPRFQRLAHDEADGSAPDRARAGAPEAPPRHFTGERELIQPLALVAAHARRQDALPPRPRREPRSPESWAMTCATPRGPSRRYSGSACCQQARKRRNWEAVTGSISLRRRSSV